jgi:hypothetical protein
MRYYNLYVLEDNYIYKIAFCLIYKREYSSWAKWASSY